MNLVITLKPHEVISCDEVIMRNYEALDTRENKIDEIKIGADVPDQLVQFFGFENDAAPLLTLGSCTLTDLKMTRVESYCELWVKVEHKNTDQLHNFVKDYAFTRFWVEFLPKQRSLDEVITAMPKAVKMTSTPSNKVN